MAHLTLQELVERRRLAREAQAGVQSDLQARLAQQQPQGQPSELTPEQTAAETRITEIRKDPDFLEHGPRFQALHEELMTQYQRRHPKPDVSEGG